MTNWLMTKCGFNWRGRVHRARTGPEPRLLAQLEDYKRTYDENLRINRQSGSKKETRMLVAKMIHLSSSRQWPYRRRILMAHNSRKLSTSTKNLKKKGVKVLSQQVSSIKTIWSSIQVNLSQKKMSLQYRQMDWNLLSGPGKIIIGVAWIRQTY